MTVGALIFAFDSEISYTSLAVECASRVIKYLDIPVTLVSDKRVDTDVFEKQIIVERGADTNRRFFVDRQESTTWFNFGRYQAFKLSPYTRTLLLDSDYMINNDTLVPFLKGTQPFLCHRSVQSVHHARSRIDKFGTKNTNMWWATVVVFDKSNSFTKDVFTVWQMVEENYRHYAELFGFNARQFRNDYALSIALLLCNGNLHPAQCEIPWPLLNVDTDVRVSHIDNTWWIGYHDKNKNKRICVKNKDLHVMCKSYLEELYAISS
jgi:hypothetical protein